MSFKIRDIEIKSRFILAPMAGVTNQAYREIVKEMGAGMVVAEMVSDKALMYHNQKTLEMIKVSDKEHISSMQLFGHDIESMTSSAKYINDNSNCDIIDINMGCPVNKVIKAEAGSFLLKDPNYVYQLVKSIRSVVTKPLTVKIRIGFDHDHINVLEIAKKIEEAGADAITIHARTRSDFYSGNAKENWHYIKEVKQILSIPVIGNGDVRCIEDAKEMFEETGCDAIAIARASLGNPFIFRELNAYFDNNIILDRPSNLEVFNTIMDHYNRLNQIKGEKLALLEMRGQIAYYLKGYEGASKVKNEVNQAKDFNYVIFLLKDFLKIN